MDSSLTQQLVIDIRQKPVNAHDRQRSAQHVLDWLACATAGMDSEVGRIYLSYAEQAPPGKATTIDGKQRYWPDVIACNAALGNILEMDDIHRRSILHPGPVVIPAALAMAEQVDADIPTLLDAIIHGYEVTIRLGQAIGRSHYRYFHNTSSCAAIGAAMACATLLKLSVEQTVSALGNTGSRTGGLWQMRHESVMTKQWHNSEAAKSGALAAWLAKTGLTGPTQILEGPQGVFAALSDDATPGAFIAKAPDWLIYDCSFKPWPACRHAHPAMDALLHTLEFANNKRRPQNSAAITADDIAAIDIFTYQDAVTFCDRLQVNSENHAKFSIQHAISALIIKGEPRLKHYQQDSFTNPLLVEFRQKVNVYVSTEIENRYPKHYGATCTITMIDGQSFSVERIDTLGDPECPMSENQLTHKARMLFDAAGLAQADSQALLELDWTKKKDLTNLTQHFGTARQDVIREGGYNG
ncbi:MmgE/PrpD family protein [Thalassotalea mangrovi]|uniref:MmgE/PrpD family protein n=1 Tax=Thalassotalea mangrovi TaxID=2572245 RepID=A0A4U1B1Y9_9GAMM|nr:MmgE/PrpD family protein [Thalassotalea mangrovi]TKB43279.1 MmgE/PrpD family protein [Thalassotalea mangrovi]